MPAVRTLLVLVAVAVLGACGSTGATSTPTLQLVESWPLETTLDDPAVEDAAAVWVSMIARARTSLDIEQFYAVTSDKHPAFEKVLDAIAAAGKRGVKVRVIFDKKFYGRMPEVPDRIAKMQGVDVRHIDMGKLTKGVQHTKFFIVDGAEAFVGSQNFDWRSLVHIQELGVRIRLRQAVAAIKTVFETDWKLAGGATIAEARSDIPHAGTPIATRYGGAPATVVMVFDPKPLVTPERGWELPHLLKAIDGAKKRVRVQLLSYKTKNYDKTTFTALDEALRRAAGRGVEVQLMVADWSKRKGHIEGLQSLQEVANLTVKLVTIPAHSAGFIPFARVIHTKAMTVDGRMAWVGTSNWAGDYFTSSRNVGLVVESKAFTRDVDRHFERTWASTYAEVVDPKATYTAPKRY